MLLKLIRKHTKLLFILILVLILFPFLFFGIGSIGKETFQEQDQLTVQGRKISPERFKIAAFDSQLQLLVDFVEGNNIKNTEQFNMYKDWFNKLLEQIDMRVAAFREIILQNEVDSYGITISKDEVVRWIADFPLFQTGSAFDIERYNTFISNSFRTGPTQFENALTRVLAVKKLRKFISDSVIVSDREVYTAYREANEKVIVYYTEFPTQEFIRDVPVIEESEIKEYYESNKEKFRKPESIKISYLLFDPLNYKKDAQISQKEMEDYYEANKDNYKDKNGNIKTLDSVNDEIKNMLTDEQAKEISDNKALETSLLLTKEKRIGDMASLAKEKGLVIKETDYIPKGQIFIPQLGPAQEVMQTAWDMETGTISDLINAGNKRVIISPKERKETEIPVLEEVKAKIADILKNKKAEELAKQKGEETLSKLPKDKPFPMAAKSLGLKAKKSKQITKSNEHYTRATELKKTPKGYTLVYMDKFFPIDEKKWEKEKQNFTETYLAQKKRKFLQNWLASITK